MFFIKIDDQSSRSVLMISILIMILFKIQLYFPICILSILICWKIQSHLMPTFDFDFFVIFKVINAVSSILYHIYLR